MAQPEVPPGMPSSGDEVDLVSGLEADLQALAAAEADLDRDAEVAERTRIERSAVTLADRLRAARGPVEISTAGGGRHAGRIVETGEDWVRLEHVPVGARASIAEHVVRTASVHVVRGLGRAHGATAGGLPPRSLASLLRTWCRDRSDVSVLLVDGAVIAGLASAAYADHLEISTGGGATVAVPFAAMAVVSR